MNKEPNTMLDAVESRYAKAAEKREALLCCPVDYDTSLLKIIPQEVLERDYGCGDPSKYVKEGETVLDLGSGGGKICFIASQIVGAKGKVIGVDMTDSMLELARTSEPKVAEKTGYHNTIFKKGKIEDLALDRDLLERYLKKNPVSSDADYKALELKISSLRKNSPMIEDESIDIILSNCVLNLVDQDSKNKMFKEIFRVLKKGGRIAISDIVSDEIVPEHLKNDEELWSGCISGAYEERAFLRAFEEAGFYGVTIDKRDEKPWQTIEGIEFRSVTVVAYKGKQGKCYDHKEALIYKGPFKSVTDDDGHTFTRGVRTAVCRKTFNIFQKEPYNKQFFSIKPYKQVSEKEALLFPCTEGELVRRVSETKGKDYHVTEYSACDSDGCC